MLSWWQALIFMAVVCYVIDHAANRILAKLDRIAELIARIRPD